MAFFSLRRLATVLFASGWDEYEAEQERAQRHRKKLAAIYDRDERFREEKEIEDAGN